MVGIEVFFPPGEQRILRWGGVGGGDGGKAPPPPKKKKSGIRITKRQLFKKRKRIRCLVEQTRGNEPPRGVGLDVPGEMKRCISLRFESERVASYHSRCLELFSMQTFCHKRNAARC